MRGSLAWGGSTRIKILRRCRSARGADSLHEGAIRSRVEEGMEGRLMGIDTLCSFDANAELVRVAKVSIIGSYAST